MSGYFWGQGKRIAKKKHNTEKDSMSKGDNKANVDDVNCAEEVKEVLNVLK